MSHRASLLKWPSMLRIFHLSQCWCHTTSKNRAARWMTPFLFAQGSLLMFQSSSEDLLHEHLRHRKRSVSHHPKASQRESPAHRWETIRKSPRHDGIMVDIGRIHAYYMRLRRAWAAQRIQFLTRHFQTTSQSNWFDKKKNRQNRQRSWPQLSSVSALDLATADHSITHSLNVCRF